MMRRFPAAPVTLAAWYVGFWILLFVLGRAANVAAPHPVGGMCLSGADR